MGVEHYTRVRKLGKGSFGDVYLVVDKRDGRQYVMKEVDIAQFGPKGRREALKEVAFLNAMHHPCIVAIREYFEHDSGGGRKMLHIVMEFADGGDLSGRIKAQNGRFFPESTVISWFVQICLAVKHIHDRKIIHRDLKSENIFLMKSTSSNHSQVKLGDFGISKSMAHTMANAITRIGTPYYLSPEICMNKPYNAKSDMWSLGVVLYELMCLKHPFDATSMEGLLSKIVKSQPPPLPKQYSIELRTVVDSLLSKQPAKRPNVNALLKLPFLAQHVSSALSPAQISDEFSHTVIHSDASARALPAVQPQLPPSGRVAQRDPPLPPPTGIRPVQQQQQQQQQLQQQPQAQQYYLHQPPSRNGYNDPSARGGAGGGAVTPYRNGHPSAMGPGPSSVRPPSSHRAGAGRDSPSSAYGAVPPSPFAGMSNADAIRMIRERKEGELREARAAQLSMQRRREQAQAEMAADAERERAAAMRAREASKERQMQQAHARGGPDYNLPPALRGREAVAAARGIPAVASRRESSAAAAPLHGAPYQDRPGGPAPTRLQQHAALAEQARRVREDELARMRVNYFKDRKMKRESKLADVHGSGRASPYAQQQHGAYGNPPRASAAAPSAYGYPSRPGSDDRYGAPVGHARRPSQQQQQQAPSSRWR